MTITGGAVLFVVLWFLCLFIALQTGITTQAEDGRVVPGTPASAPANPQMKRRFLRVTLIAAALWLPLVLFIEYGPLTVRDIDFMGTFEGRH
ncbi:MAG: DUF1467 domain-containing protein [Alphaproteobacteria bacterium HGW-Alphaproteobacteria-2]|nr:MAG: DUF1467 domain-containing protein [Alphaproteobacteria bacterium HGW-Alphaproteobacteria-2]